MVGCVTGAGFWEDSAFTLQGLPQLSAVFQRLRKKSRANCQDCLVSSLGALINHKVLIFHLSLVEMLKVVLGGWDRSWSCWVGGWV